MSFYKFSFPILVGMLLASCSKSPSCDDGVVADQLKGFVVNQSHVVGSPTNLTCFGLSGCAPFIDGNKIQFHTLQMIAGEPKSRPLLTFSIDTTDFLNGFQMSLGNVRMIARDDNVHRVTCTANIRANIDTTTIKNKIPSGETVLFKNFDGNVPGWHKQLEYKMTPLEQVRQMYAAIIWNDPTTYSVQYTTEGKLFVEVQ